MNVRSEAKTYVLGGRPEGAVGIIPQPVETTPVEPVYGGNLYRMSAQDYVSANSTVTVKYINPEGNCLDYIRIFREGVKITGKYLDDAGGTHCTSGYLEFKVGDPGSYEFKYLSSSGKILETFVFRAE